MSRTPHHPFPEPFPIEYPTTFPAAFSTAFPTAFATAFPVEFLKLDADWLAPHHNIPNAKFPPITALLNRSTYHKSAKGSPTTVSPKSHGNLKSMNKLTLTSRQKKQPCIIAPTILSKLPSI